VGRVRSNVLRLLALRKIRLALMNNLNHQSVSTFRAPHLQPQRVTVKSLNIWIQ
jgi:hypothetical protein